MDIDKAIRTAVDTGKVLLGADRARKLALTGGAKLVVIARNCPEGARRDLVRYCELSAIPVFSYGGSSLELGTVCGKPFPVSALSIVEEGSSDIMRVVGAKAGEAKGGEELKESQGEGLEESGGGRGPEESVGFGTVEESGGGRGLASMG